MKIVNTTCYDSGDILGLWGLCRQAYTEEQDESEHTYKYVARDPETLEVGYYNPKEEKPSFFTRLSRHRSNGRPPRLAIVKPKRLPLSPLEHLATAADESAALPASLMEELITHFRHALGGYSQAPQDERWAKVRAFRVRYSMRAKRGSLMSAKKAAKEIKRDVLRSKYWQAERTVRNCRDALREAERVKEELLKKVRTAEAECGD